MKMSQEKKLLEYLTANYHVDPITSFIKLGIYRLAARIYDLRRKGHIIDSMKDPQKNTYYVYRGSSNA